MKTKRKAKPATALDARTRRLIRIEVRAALVDAVVECQRLIRSAGDLSVDLGNIRDSQEVIKHVAKLAEESLTIAAALRHEWVEAKMLAKIFEQREFLGLPMIREARASLLRSNGFDIRMSVAPEQPKP